MLFFCDCRAKINERVLISYLVPDVFRSNNLCFFVRLDYAFNLLLATETDLHAEEILICMHDTGALWMQIRSTV